MNERAHDRNQMADCPDLLKGADTMPRKHLQIYRCPVCDTTVEVLEQWGMELICCGREMAALRARGGGAGKNRHVPVIEPAAEALRVTVGGEPHPMAEDHRIVWIEIVAEGRSYRQFLEPGQPPEARFVVQSDDVVARAYCSVHGLWQSKPGGTALGTRRKAPTGALG